jgi:superfamily II DNA/RNA helicase
MSDNSNIDNNEQLQEESTTQSKVKSDSKPKARKTAKAVKNDDDRRSDRGSNNNRNRNRNSNRNNRGRQNGRSGSKDKNEEKKSDEPIAEIVENNDNFDLPNLIEDFDDMRFLPEELLTGVYDYGFKFPSPVQARSIHIVNSGHDMIVQSDSGTGKTGAFTIGTLSIIEPNVRHPQAIIIANTHPLANQIYAVVEKLSARMGIRVCLCVGGGRMRPEQNAKAARKSHILIGTPGRMKDIALKNVFKAQNIKVLIMDEADELLKDDFCNDIKDIVSQVSQDTQICTFSATYTEKSYNLAKNTLMNNPYEIVIEQEQLSTERIQQYKVMLDLGSGGPGRYHNFKRQREDLEWNKLGVLVDFANRLNLNQAIIFTNHKNTAYRIRDELMRNGFAATGLVTSESDSVTREKILCQFRLCQIKFLISTDLISRGIDIDDLRCVINFDFPKTSESYIHRIGRSGRYGGKGVAINLMTYDDAYLLTQLRNEYQIVIDDMPDIEDVNRILVGFEPPTDKASSSQNYK